MTRKGLSIESAVKAGTLILRVRKTIERCQSDLEGRFDKLMNVGGNIEALIGSTPDAHLAHSWRLMRTGVALLASQGRCLANAHGQNGDLAAEQARLNVLYRELQQLLKTAEWDMPASLGPLSEVVIESPECDPAIVARLLLALPLPTVYWEVSKERDDEPTRHEDFRDDEDQRIEGKS